MIMLTDAELSIMQIIDGTTTFRYIEKVMNNNYTVYMDTIIIFRPNLVSLENKYSDKIYLRVDEALTNCTCNFCRSNWTIHE